jgi:hypothetical protein
MATLRRVDGVDLEATIPAVAAVRKRVVAGIDKLR